jgi:eukaryotic-like serine/threonine-protein kinase
VTIVGTVLGKYRILSELSSGGMGEVYRAQHEILGRSAAVKVLKPELTEDATLVSRFINEAKAASAIRHPGIIEVLDFGVTEDGRSYLVMEFLEGESLGKRIETRKRLPDHEAAELGRGIARALDAAHAKGIVHRDLKPDNIFIVPDIDTGERPKVLDFGIAKLADANSRNTQTGALMGTPMYMAPEQARAAAQIDHRADLYSLGCILYELVVGEPPFVGAGAGEIIALHMFETPVPPRKRVMSVSPVLEAVILKLLAKEPVDRFQSAAQVAEALHLRNPANSASLTIPHEIAAPPPRRNTMPIIAGAITVCIAAAVIGFFVLSGSDEPKTPAAVKQAAPPAPVTVQDPSPPPPAPAPAPAPAPVTTVKPTKTTKPTPVTAPRPADNRHTKNGFPTETSID